jgi:hypothetical protein
LTSQRVVWSDWHHSKNLPLILTFWRIGPIISVWLKKINLKLTDQVGLAPSPLCLYSVVRRSSKIHTECIRGVKLGQRFNGGDHLQHVHSVFHILVMHQTGLCALETRCPLSCSGCAGTMLKILYTYWKFPRSEDITSAVQAL